MPGASRANVSLIPLARLSRTGVPGFGTPTTTFPLASLPSFFTAASASIPPSS